MVIALQDEVLRKPNLIEKEALDKALKLESRQADWEKERADFLAKLKWYADSQLLMDEDRGRVRDLENELTLTKRELKN